MPGELIGRGSGEITVRALFIARVLGTSPLRLETLDSRAQQVNRRMTVVLDDIHGGKDPGTCGMALGPAMAVAAEVQALLPSLRFNDLVSGEWMLQRDAKNPQSPLGGRPVVSGLRKLSAPASWFHPVPATPNCQNRSGRLIVYTDPASGLLTVYNDGAIQYSTQYGQVFAREHLSAEELKDLLGAFAAANTDTLPAASDDLARMSGSRLTLLAARYQTVRADSLPPALAPVIGRLDLLKARAMSNARLVLGTGAARAIQPDEAAGVQEIATALRTSQTRIMRAVVRPDGTISSEPMTVDEAPELASLYGPKYLWPGDLGVRLADIPPDGLAIPWSEVERHKLVYYALMNARFKGLSLIDGDRLFEGVRLCQIEPAGFNSCGPK